MMSDDSEEHLRDHADETEAALAAAQKILHTAGIVEIAARNPQVMEYMQHWETRAEKAEGERDAAIAALSEEGRRRGEVDAERDALREALEEARGLILGANHGPTRYPRAFALLLGEVDREVARDG